MAAYREYGDLFADGTDLVLGVSMNAIGDTSSGACGVLVFINDVTETARLRRELEGKKRLVALGEMAGGLAHQIRNSLGAISGYANLCKKQLRKAEQSEERADTLLAETKEAETLIGRFLTFARPFDYTPSPTRLDMLVRDTVEQFEIREDCGNITFDICAPRAITVQADQVLLDQTYVKNTPQAGAGLHTPLPGLLFAPLVQTGEFGLEEASQESAQLSPVAAAEQPPTALGMLEAETELQ